ncbi:hypothetical protein BD410DRAFT_80991 [Rickenella mellea]|uniref:Uncharacterized protein n=1 Tax=Rickenella mellea TaxID=50990 RepID=A0A4Y7PLJ6_9AGAM|nr:hypothetical protein BD410DRAFT_80991 [Rickenella mellea]
MKAVRPQLCIELQPWMTLSNMSCQTSLSSATCIIVVSFAKVGLLRRNSKRSDWPISEVPPGLASPPLFAQFITVRRVLKNHQMMCLSYLNSGTHFPRRVGKEDGSICWATASEFFPLFERSVLVIPPVIHSQRFIPKLPRFYCKQQASRANLPIPDILRHVLVTEPETQGRVNNLSPWI